MPFSNEVKMYLPFTGVPVFDTISITEFDPVGNQTINIFNDKFGYIMKRNQYLTAQIDFDITTAFTISFWLYPMSPGMAQNPTTDALESLRLPLMNNSNLDIDLYSGDTIASESTFTLYETTLNDGTNELNVLLEGVTNTATVTSVAYDTEQWHHFWLAFDGSVPELKMFIDGLEVSTTVSGTIPSLLVQVDTDEISINKSAPGSTYQVLKNTGIIDDVLILNKYEITEAIIQKSINFSPGVAFDIILSQSLEVEQVIAANDPDAITLSNSTHDGIHVYSARSDGRIMLGQSLAWEKRWLFDKKSMKGGDPPSGFEVIVQGENGVKFEDNSIIISNGVISVS